MLPYLATTRQSANGCAAAEARACASHSGCTAAFQDGQPRSSMSARSAAWNAAAKDGDVKLCPCTTISASLHGVRDA